MARSRCCSPQAPSLRVGWKRGDCPELLDAAALRPNMRFRLLWRPWGASRETIGNWVRERGLRNVEIIDGRVEDMPSEYRSAHVTVAPFTRMDRCKPMTNSLIESLACGRPILCTPEVGLARSVEDSRAGVVVRAVGGRHRRGPGPAAGRLGHLLRCIAELGRAIVFAGAIRQGLSAHLLRSPAISAQVIPVLIDSLDPGFVVRSIQDLSAAEPRAGVGSDRAFS